MQTIPYIKCYGFCYAMFVFLWPLFLFLSIGFFITGSIVKNYGRRRNKEVTITTGEIFMLMGGFMFIPVLINLVMRFGSILGFVYIPPWSF